MKKSFLLKTMLLLCALVAGSGSVWAADQTLFDVTDKDYWETSNSTYNSTVWSSNGCIFEYAANNNKGWAYVRLGGKSLENVNAYIATTTATTIQTKQLDVTVVTPKSNNSLTINSITLYIYGSYNTSTNAYSNEVEHISYDVSKYAAGTMTFKPSSGDYWDTGVYFKLVYNLSNSTNKNYGTDVSKLVAKEYTSGGTPTVETPTFNHGTATYTTAQSVELSCETASATIHYTMTTDGSTPDDPTESDPTYTTTPISVTLTGTKIKAKAFKAGYNASSVASATYTIQPTKPTFEVTTVVAGKVNRGAQLTMSAAAGNTIIYTTDGTAASYSEPNGDIYDTPITINNPMTIKAIAVDNYGNESQQTVKTYAIYYAGGVDITPNFTFFGKTEQFSGDSNEEVTGTTAEGIVVTYTRHSGSLYANTSAMRLYKSNTLKIDAPAGKTITNVVFTQSNDQSDDMTSTPNGYSSTTKTWSGDASSVTFTRPLDAASNLTFTNIEVVLAPKVTIASSGYSTIASSYALDCANLPSGLKSYKVSDISKSAVTLEEVTTAVAASTGLILEGTASTSYTIPVVVSGTDISGTNKLHAAVTATTLADGSFYIMKGGKFCLVTGAADAAARTVPAGKAYLLAEDVPASAPEFLDFIFNFGGETTGVNDVRSKTADEFATPHSALQRRGDFFDLQGRKVANPKKGLYIVNGKKVAIK